MYMQIRLARIILFLILVSLPVVAAAQTRDKVGKLTKYFETACREEGFSGVVLVAGNGKPLVAKACGLANVEFRVPNTIRTKFRIGSMTKQFTAAAIMMLQERGKFKVSDPIDKYLRDIPEQWKGITIRQLLSHTSGLMHSWALPEFEKTMMIPATTDETLARFWDKPLLFKPGEGFLYSGVGYFLLARVIEETSGVSYETFLKENIFAPLAMKDTGSDRPELVLNDRASGYDFKDGRLLNAPIIYMPKLAGGGNLYSTVEDLLRWDQALYTDRILSKKSFTEMTTPVRNDYGYGWLIKESFGRRLMTHGGDVPGFTAYIARYTDDRVTIIVLNNVTNVPAGKIGKKLATILYGENTDLQNKEKPKPRR